MVDFFKEEGDNNKNEERYGNHVLPANWRRLPERERRELFRDWSRREYKKYIGALPRWMQKQVPSEDEDED